MGTNFLERMTDAMAESLVGTDIKGAQNIKVLGHLTDPLTNSIINVSIFTMLIELFTKWFHEVPITIFLNNLEQSCFLVLFNKLMRLVKEFMKIQSLGICMNFEKPCLE